MISWRITKRRYSSRSQILGGEGARTGGRWNRPGLSVVYSSENSSLALLENLVRTTASRLPKSLVAVRISIPDDVPLTDLAAGDLPANWRDIENPGCIALGSKWLESRKALVLRVPSAVNSLERNLLLNPMHAAIESCEVGKPVPLVFDPRAVAFFAASP